MQESLQNWMQKLIQLDGFESDPVNAIITSSEFKISDDDLIRLEKLTEEEKVAFVGRTRAIAECNNPDELRKTYAELAQSYESYFGWEGIQEDMPRSWCP